MADSRQREPATPEEIWAILREVSASQRETDRRMQETDRRMRQLDELFNGQWGKLMEALVEGDLVKLLNQRGIEVHFTTKNMKGERGGRRWEVDILAFNSDEAVVVEVKTTLKVRDIDHFVALLKDFADLAPQYRDMRVYGAVAYLKADLASDVYAERQGLFVIRATGSSSSITNRADFRPRSYGRSPEVQRAPC